MDRRSCLKAVGVAAGAALASQGRPARGESRSEAPPNAEEMGVLVDTTLCIGCRSCELACAEANGLPEPPAEPSPTESQTISPTRWTIVQDHETTAGPFTVKRQCMHCLQPACVSACLTRAMHKTPSGAVAWDGSKCMGCRFCMIACPYDAPKFEFDSANPRIRKCVLCGERTGAGEPPACVAACPAEALRFGRRSELIESAWHRILDEPNRYVHHVYGQREVGGTLFLYLAAVPFEQLGFPADLGETPYPMYTREFLYSVPFVLTLLPPFLLALSRASQTRETTALSSRQEEED